MLGHDNDELMYMTDLSPRRETLQTDCDTSSEWMCPAQHCLSQVNMTTLSMGKRFAY